MLILPYDYKFSFTCKLNSYSYEWLSIRPRLKKEAKGNSEMTFYTGNVRLKERNCRILELRGHSNSSRNFRGVRAGEKII